MPYCAVFTVIHSAQRPCPGAAPNSGRTVMVPMFGNGLQLMEGARGGTTAGIVLEKGTAKGPFELRSSMMTEAGVSIPRWKFRVRLPAAKLALNPRPQAGARVIPVTSLTAQSALSGLAVIPSSVLLAGYSVTTPLVVMRPILFTSRSVNQSAPSGAAVIQ